MTWLLDPFQVPDMKDWHALGGEEGSRWADKCAGGRGGTRTQSV